MRRKRARQGKQLAIQACEYCDAPFARPIGNGYYCTHVCRDYHQERMQVDGNPRALTVDDLITAVENESAR